MQFLIPYLPSTQPLRSTGPLRVHFRHQDRQWKRSSGVDESPEGLRLRLFLHEEKTSCLRRDLIQDFVSQYNRSEALLPLEPYLLEEALRSYLDQLQHRPSAYKVAVNNLSRRSDDRIGPRNERPRAGRRRGGTAPSCSSSSPAGRNELTPGRHWSPGRAAPGARPRVRYQPPDACCTKNISATCMSETSVS